MSAIGCTSDESTGGVATILTDVYYIRADTEFGSVFLDASRLHGPQLVGGENLEPVLIENATFAWQFSGEAQLSIRSESPLLSESQLVVRANDGLMQVALVDDAAVSTEFSSWRLLPLDNGRCNLVNDDLGTELVLSLVNPNIQPDGRARFAVEMAAVDNAIPQEWTIVRVGNPSGQFDALCGENNL